MLHAVAPRAPPRSMSSPACAAALRLVVRAPSPFVSFLAGAVVLRPGAHACAVALRLGTRDCAADLRLGTHYYAAALRLGTRLEPTHGAAPQGGRGPRWRPRAHGLLRRPPHPPAPSSSTPARSPSRPSPPRSAPTSASTSGEVGAARGSIHSCSGRGSTPRPARAGHGDGVGRRTNPPGSPSTSTSRTARACSAPCFPTRAGASGSAMGSGGSRCCRCNSSSSPCAPSSSCSCVTAPAASSSARTRAPGMARRRCGGRGGGVRRRRSAARQQGRLCVAAAQCGSRGGGMQRPGWIREEKNKEGDDVWANTSRSRECNRGICCLYGYTIAYMWVREH